MRFHLLGLMLLAGSASAFAQDRGQRPATVQPEIGAVQPQQTIGGIPASSAVADLTARIDALEAQLARLTGQVEEGNYRIRQLEQELVQARQEIDGLRSVDTAAAPGPAPREPEQPVETQTAEASTPAADLGPPNTGDPAEDAYLIGYRLWDARQYAEAQKALEAAAKKYPKHRRASYALNLAGRAYLDDGKPATAAKLLLSNYQSNPKGERAADSLYFLGQALIQLKKPAEACKVLDELQSVYPDMRDWLKQRLPQARQEARCGG